MTILLISICVKMHVYKSSNYRPRAITNKTEFKPTDSAGESPQLLQ